MSSNPYDGSYDSSDPQSFNRYVYARNNPLTVIDPSGLSGVCVSAFPYGNAEEPYVDPSINNSADCASAYGTWVETGSDATMDVSSTDPVADPGNGAYATPPSSSNSSGTGGGTVVGSGVAPNNTQQNHIDATQLPSCYKVEADVIAGDLNPFTPGWSTATGLAADATAAGSGYKATQAAIYAGTRINTKGGIGLLQPMKSSTYRGILAESSFLSKASAVLTFATFDAALIHAMWTTWNTPCR